MIDPSKPIRSIEDLNNRLYLLRKEKQQKNAKKSGGYYYRNGGIVYEETAAPNNGHWKNGVWVWDEDRIYD